MQTVHVSSCSFHDAGMNHGHPNAPSITVPSFGAVSAASNGEQGGADRPPLALLFAGRFDFDGSFFMVGDLGLRGRWGRLALDVRQTNQSRVEQADPVVSIPQIFAGRGDRVRLSRLVPFRIIILQHGLCLTDRP